MKITTEDFDTAARTIYGEARGENFAGQKAVAHVLLNRATQNKRGSTLAECATAKWQFSCWNENDPNKSKIESVTYENGTFGMCVRALLTAIDENELGYDPTFNSTHYYSKSLKTPPNWAKGHEPAAIIGQHIFFNTVV